VTNARIFDVSDLMKVIRVHFLQAAPGDRKSVRHALKQAFRDVDTSFLQSPQGDVDAGSCAIVVVIKGSTLYCANTGDSRAVLLRRKGNTRF
jgi:serine/threonine protein phosphatase PrpC